MRVPARVRRVALPIVLVLISASALARTQPAVAPVVRTISGSRLRIEIGADTSLQVWDSMVGPAFAMLLPNCLDPGATADAGILVAIDGSIFGPDFANHTCGTSAPAGFTPWTPVSISPVTGSGSASDPFTVVVVADAGSTGLRLTETVTHVDGTAYFVPTVAFSNNAAATLSWKTFLAADMYLGPTGTVQPILQLGAPGAQSALEPLGAPPPLCFPLPYYALLPAADRFTGQRSDLMWSEIAAGQLSSTMDEECPHGGIATEWTDRTLGPDASLTLTSTSPAVSFVDALPASCVANAHTLCVNEGRFAVTASFTDAPQGLPVQATAVPLTADTGYFWFFDPANVELVVKVLDGCAVNGNFWAFAGGLTNVSVLLQVTDTRTGATKPYSNALGSAFQPVQDSSAFVCP